MSRRFISYQNSHINIYKIIIIILVIILFLFIIKIPIEFKIHQSHDQIIKYFLSNSRLKPNNISFNIIPKIEPVSFLKQELLFDNDLYMKKIRNYEIKEAKNPIIYIYNTNQEDFYDKAFNTNYNILMASFVLNEKLNDLGISNIVENHDLNDLQVLNNKNSYEISSIYIKEVLDKYNLKLLIDLQIGNNESTKINNKKYAKVEFIVGIFDENDKNLELANQLNNLILKKYPELSSGITKKEGSFNQNLNNNIILITIGNKDSKFSEIYNTLDIISKIIKEYMEAKNE